MNLAQTLNRPRYGRILRQRPMGSDFIVVSSMVTEHVAEMTLAEDQHVVEALSPHRSD